MSAARGVAGDNKVIAIVQPHRYTRLSDLFDDFCTCFNNADVVISAPVYPAGEEPIEGIDHEALMHGLHGGGHKQSLKIDDPEELPQLIADLSEPGDLVIFLGAGSITHWAYALPEQLEKLAGQSKGHKGAA